MYIKHLLYEKLLVLFISGTIPKYYITFTEKYNDSEMPSLEFFFVNQKHSDHTLPLAKIKYDYKDRESIVHEINREIEGVYSLIIPTVNRYVNICKECDSIYMGLSKKRVKHKSCKSCVQKNIREACGKPEVDTSDIIKSEQKFVYLMRSELTGLLKIGISKDPIKRCRTLETAQGGKIELLKVIAGGRNVEKKLHAHFTEYRKDGEWFKYSNEIINYFDSI